MPLLHIKDDIKGHCRYEVFTVVKIQVKVSWVMTPHSVTVGYQHSRGHCCFNLLLYVMFSVNVTDQVVCYVKEM
jgi:hypothetical protein